MPSATNSAMASTGSKAGSEATAAAASAQASGAAAAAVVVPGGSTSSVQTEAMKQILGVIDKKLRNLEKKKVCVGAVADAFSLWYFNDCGVRSLETEKVNP